MGRTRATDRTTVTTATAADDLEGLLLRRLGTVYVDAPGNAPGDASADADADADADAAAGADVTAAGLTALEADLALRGYVLTSGLRAALARLAPADLAVHGIRLLGRIDSLLGADRRHVPLFRGFPEAVPDFAHSLYSERILAFLLAQPHQPCVHCGRTGDIGALAPCAHLVCSECLRGPGEQDPQDGQDPQGHRDLVCPVCGTGVDDRDAPCLDPAEARTRPGTRRRKAEADAPEPSGTLRPLRLGKGPGPECGAAAVLADLLARRTPLPPQDRADLATVLPRADPGLEWLPERIPVRETRAVVLAALLRDPRTADAARDLLPGRLDTATDVLRLLWAWSGGEPDLLAPPRLRSVPRALRRTLLGVLDALPPDSVAEDVLRHRQAWKRAGEVLHPFEYRARFPRAAVAFSALRGTDLSADAAAPLLDAAAEAGDRVRLTGGSPDGPVRLAVRTFASEAEELLATGDTAAATALLARRPGELVRRLHHLLRAHGAWNAGDASAPVLPHGLPGLLPGALRQVAPGPLLGAWSRLRTPHSAGERRVFFPRGRTSLAHGVDDHAPPVPPAAAAQACALLEDELLRRAAAAGRDREPAPVPGQTCGPRAAVVDAGLADLPVPFAERAASRALVAVPRGSRQPVPEGGRLRLFLHWTEPKGRRADLDLSVALYDDRWNFVGLCDYTHLRFGADAAVHSGDFTSAPPPHGSTEFVDLDAEALARAGARYAVTVVFSYNDVPFDELTDAFAGFMPLGAHAAAGTARSRAARRTAAGAGALYDPRRVAQRFDLAGEARVSAPMVLDLAERSVLWTDMNLSSAGGLHNVYRHRGRLGQLVRDVDAHFAPGSRATVWDLAARLAAAGCDEVHVRSRDGRSAARYLRGADEPVERYAARVLGGREHDGLHTGTAEETARVLADVAHERGRFLALVHGDLPASSLDADLGLYRLYPGPLDAAAGSSARLLTAGDLVARFAPAEPGDPDTP
ncbi:MXAN_6230/SCO0854 family RING domain-containing protein [Streptomyces thermolineatus]|uniref:MXAN_6230/SCO0854 family RING domain-containing protein n=1 Tax=Streptomyces thermolineatus TaxID=44033 RepID=UPI00384F39E3